MEKLIIDVAGFDDGYVVAPCFAQVSCERLQQLRIGDDGGVPPVVTKHESGLDRDLEILE